MTGPELTWSGLRGSNPRPPPWQGGALPTALSPRRKEICYASAPGIARLFLTARSSRPALLARRREAARTSRQPPGGRPHFSAAVIKCGRRRTRRAHSAPPAEKDRALDARRRQDCPHSMPALDARTRRARPDTKRRPGGRPSSPGGEARIRTGGQGFAGPCLTTWPLRRMKKAEQAGLELAWSGLRGSNPRPPPWQGGALPTALSPQVRGI